VTGALCDENGICLSAANAVEIYLLQLWKIPQENDPLGVLHSKEIPELSRGIQYVYSYIQVLGILPVIDKGLKSLKLFQ
jgi:hypothetical protein